MRRRSDDVGAPVVRVVEPGASRRHDDHPDEFFVYDGVDERVEFLRRVMDSIA
jgi:hypothetical protein